jgi:putative peptide zinc metalloprotease protein
VIAMTERGPGRSAVVLAEDMEGRFVRKGELLAHVLALPTFTVRAILPQADIDLVRTRTRRVELRLADRIPDVLPATVTRVVPGASDRLPAPALGIGGGGDVGVDPTDPEGLKATESVFQVDLRLPPQAGALTVGGRVYLRFDHGTEPLALQWHRRLRQLFLARFHV